MSQRYMNIFYQKSLSFVKAKFSNFLVFIYAKMLYFVKKYV